MVGIAPPAPGVNTGSADSVDRAKVPRAVCTVLEILFATSALWVFAWDTCIRHVVYSFPVLTNTEIAAFDESGETTRTVNDRCALRAARRTLLARFGRRQEVSGMAHLTRRSTLTRLAVILIRKAALCMAPSQKQQEHNHQHFDFFFWNI